MPEESGDLIRVLVVDDSVMMRAILRRALATEPDVKVVGAAGSGQDALEMIDEIDPSVVTLDVEMPGMSGIEVLEQIMQARPRPVVMVSART